MKDGHMKPVKWHSINHSGRIAYKRVSGKGPGVVYLCGHGSDMEGGKALFLESWAKYHNRSFLRFDYSGHGKSDGDFFKTNICSGPIT